MKRDTTGLLLPIVTALLAAGVWSGLAVAETVDFEDANVGGELGPQEYWNGSDGSGGFSSGSLGFNNTFTDFGGGYFGWTGWSYSNTTDTTTPGFGNQYSAYADYKAGVSNTYGVAYNWSVGDASITIPEGYTVVSAMIANTSYAAWAMREGTSFGEKFSENEQDWFLLTVYGKDGAGQGTGSEEIYLADYRDTNTGEDNILSDWISIDLSSLMGASKLEFSLTSSDVGEFGMNTPAYFAMDNIVLEQVPEPSTVVMLLSAAAALLLVRRRRR